MAGFKGGKAGEEQAQYYANNAVNRKAGIAGLKKTADKVESKEYKKDLDGSVLAIKDKLLKLKSGQEIELKSKDNKTYVAKMSPKRNVLTLSIREDGASKPRKLRDIQINKSVKSVDKEK